jgi:hypothetical protein
MPRADERSVNCAQSGTMPHPSSRPGWCDSATLGSSHFARGEHMQERATPVKVFDDLVRETVRWVEVHRPLEADRDGATQWVLSAAFSMVVVAGAACASIGALGGEIAEEDFLDLAREAFRRAHGNVAGRGASA